MNIIFPSATSALAGVVKDGQRIVIGSVGLCGISYALIAIAALCGSRVKNRLF
jgi:3-oxoacid CoA-transferase subunit A